MAIRSHVDTWMFIKFINLNEKNIEDSINPNDINRKDKEELLKIYDTQYNRSKTLIFHETYHLWQGVRLPFLHRYAILVLRDTMNSFRNIAADNDNLNTWDLSLNYNELYGLHRKMKFQYVGEDFFYYGHDRSYNIYGTEPNLNKKGEAEFSIIDLLEASTSIAEFQFSCLLTEDAFDKNKFNLWQKRNPANVTVYNFLSNFFENKSLVLRIIIPLINASFNTTDPLRAFAELSKRIYSAIQNTDNQVIQFIQQNEPCHWRGFMNVFLNEITFDPKSSEWHELAINSGFHKLSIENLVGSYINSKGEKMDLHPILSPLLKEWLKLENSVPNDTQNILDSPFQNKQVYESLWSYYDTLSIIKFNFGSNYPLILTRFPSDRVAELYNIQAIEYMFTVVGIMRRATGINFDTNHRLCHHTDCTYYDSNFCNSYLRIPQDFKNCEFPDDFKLWAKLSNEYNH